MLLKIDKLEENYIRAGELEDIRLNIKLIKQKLKL